MKLEILPRSYRRARLPTRLMALALFASAAAVTRNPREYGFAIMCATLGLLVLVAGELLMGRPETWWLAAGRARRRIAGRTEEAIFVPAGLRIGLGGHSNSDPELLLVTSDGKEVRVGPAKQRLENLVALGRVMAGALWLEAPQAPPADGEEKSGYGCLILALAMVSCFVGGIYLMVINSRVYEDAVARAKENQRVQDVLGSPVKTGWLVRYGSRKHSGRKVIEASIPLKGPKGEGTLRVVAQDNGDSVAFEQLYVSAGGEIIHVSRSPRAPAPRSPASSSTKRAPELEGSGLRGFEMADEDSDLCVMACWREPQCKVYVVVKSTFLKSARCHLLESLPDDLPPGCCRWGTVPGR